MSTKYCHACHQEISSKAHRCHHCNAWQGIRFWLSVARPAFLLLIAAIGFWWGLLEKITENQVLLQNNQEEIRALGKPYEFAFRRWQQENIEFIENTGSPGEQIIPISILWYQFFETGYILYNASQGWSIILNFKRETWQKQANDSAILISHYNKEKINIKRFDQLYNEANGGERNYYLDLFKEGAITGGIGNLYVKHDLGPVLGKPLKAEMWIENAGFVRGTEYDLIVGVINRPTDREDSIVRAVYALFKDHNTYKRFVITNRPRK